MCVPRTAPRFIIIALCMHNIYISIVSIQPNDSSRLDGGSETRHFHAENYNYLPLLDDDNDVRACVHTLDRST